MKYKARESTKEKYAEAQRLIASGQPIVHACKAVGLTTTTFYTHRKNQPTGKLRKKTAPPETIEVPTPFRASQIALILGSPHDISATLQSLRAGGAL